MISSENLGSIAGAPVEGADGNRIGTVGQIFADPDSGVPTWVTVHTGLFGRHETFVPLKEADWDREVLHVPYSKDLVKDAPRIDTEGSLEAELEVELLRYYGLDTVGPAVGDERDSADVPTAEVQESRSDESDLSEMQESRSDESDLSENSAAAHDEPDPNRKGRHRA